MKSNMFAVAYIVVLIAVIVAVDMLFFSGSSETGARLIVNIGIVLVDAAFYMIFLRKW